MRSSVSKPNSAAISFRIGRPCPPRRRRPSPSPAGRRSRSSLSCRRASIASYSWIISRTAWRVSPETSSAGKPLQHRQHQLVLPGVAPQLQLAEQPLGAELPQRPDRRGQLRLHFGVVRESPRRSPPTPPGPPRSVRSGGRSARSSCAARCPSGSLASRGSCGGCRGGSSWWRSACPTCR